MASDSALVALRRASTASLDLASELRALGRTRGAVPWTVADAYGAGALQPYSLPGVSRPLVPYLALKHVRRRLLQSGLTVAGVAVGVAVLIVALSLTNGFIDELVTSTLRATPMVTMQSYLPGDTLPNDAAILQAVAGSPGVTSAWLNLADSGARNKPSPAWTWPVSPEIAAFDVSVRSIRSGTPGTGRLVISCSMPIGEPGLPGEM